MSKLKNVLANFVFGGKIVDFHAIAKEKKTQKNSLCSLKSRITWKVQIKNMQTQI